MNESELKKLFEQSLNDETQETSRATTDRIIDTQTDSGSSRDILGYGLGALYMLFAELFAPLIGVASRKALQLNTHSKSHSQQKVDTPHE